MSILINKNTRLIVQGITGRDGSFHATKMKEYGTNVVGGTSPGKGGQEVKGIPVFNTVKEAVAATKANTSIIFVPARRVNQQVQNYKTCLKNSRFGVEKFNFSLGLSFNFFCIDIILLSV